MIRLIPSFFLFLVGNTQLNHWSKWWYSFITWTHDTVQNWSLAIQVTFVTAPYFPIFFLASARGHWEKGLSHVAHVIQSCGICDILHIYMKKHVIFSISVCIHISRKDWVMSRMSFSHVVHGNLRLSCRVIHRNMWYFAHLCEGIRDIFHVCVYTYIFAHISGCIYVHDPHMFRHIYRRTGSWKMRWDFNFFRKIHFFLGKRGVTCLEEGRGRRRVLVGKEKQSESGTNRFVVCGSWERLFESWSFKWKPTQSFYYKNFTTKSFVRLNVCPFLLPAPKISGVVSMCLVVRSGCLRVEVYNQNQLFVIIYTQKRVSVPLIHQMWWRFTLWCK